MVSCTLTPASVLPTAENLRGCPGSATAPPASRPRFPAPGRLGRAGPVTSRHPSPARRRPARGAPHLVLCLRPSSRTLAPAPVPASQRQTASALLLGALHEPEGHLGWVARPCDR